MNLKFEVVFRLKKIYWFLARPKRQGVKCILEHDGKILMVRRRFGTSKYVFPGGAIKKNETPEMAVRREIKEDLDVTLGGVRPRGSFSQEVYHRRETLYVFVASIPIAGSKFDHEKIQSITWFGLDELPELTPVTKSVLAQYRLT